MVVGSEDLLPVGGGRDVQLVAVLGFEPLAEVERRAILSTLGHYDGDKKRAAEVLGISLKTLYNRLKKYKERA